MAHLHNFHKNQNTDFFSSIGLKNKFGAEVAGADKTIFDVGKNALFRCWPGRTSNCSIGLMKFGGQIPSTKNLGFNNNFHKIN